MTVRLRLLALCELFEELRLRTSVAAQIAPSPLEWLGGSRGVRMACHGSWRAEDPVPVIGDRYGGFSQGQAHPHCFFPFLFSSSCWDSVWQRFSLRLRFFKS